MSTHPHIESRPLTCYSKVSMKFTSHFLRTPLAVTCFLSSLLLPAVFTSCKKTQKTSPDLASLISLISNEETNTLAQKQWYYLDSENFDLYFAAPLNKTGISIFAHYSAAYQDKYILPVKADDTVMFKSGCALAQGPLDPQKGYTLNVNSENTFTYIFGDRKIDTQDGFILPVRAIADATGNYSNNLYLSFYADFNGNKIIEPNEYAVLSLCFPVSFNQELDFSREKRAYFSSMGYGLKKQIAQYTGNEFRVYKIKTHKDFEKICVMENKNLINRTLESIYLHYFDQKNLIDKKVYLCFIPQNFNQVGNTFRIRGSKNVFIEVEQDTPQNERRVNIRSFDLPSDSPDADVTFYLDGKLINVPVTEF